MKTCAVCARNLELSPEPIEHPCDLPKECECPWSSLHVEDDAVELDEERR
jgi:hypothetical protein